MVGRQSEGLGGVVWVYREREREHLSLHSQQTGRLRYFALLLSETKGQTFRGILYSTAVIFSVHLVTVKYEGFTTTSTMEIQLRARPATQLTRSPLMPANRVRRSISHARRFRERGRSARVGSWTYIYVGS